VRERRGDGPLREKRTERFALVEAERRDVDQSDDVRRVCAERRDDLAAVRVPDDDCRTVLEVEYLTQPGDVVGQRAQRKLRCSDLETLRLQTLDDGPPAGPICPRAMNENDGSDDRSLRDSLLLLVDAGHATSLALSRESPIGAPIKS
jgi:hypothetical protein